MKLRQAKKVCKTVYGDPITSLRGFKRDITRYKWATYTRAWQVWWRHIGRKDVKSSSYGWRGYECLGCKKVLLEEETFFSPEGLVLCQKCDILSQENGFIDIKVPLKGFCKQLELSLNEVKNADPNL